MCATTKWREWMIRQVVLVYLVTNSSCIVPLSLGSTSRSSAEQGLSSLPSFEMVRNDVGDTDWERLLLLLPLSAPPGVCVSMLRVLLLLCTRGGGARWPSGISCGCYKILKTCVFVIDFEIHHKCTQNQRSPIVPDDSQIRNAPLGLTRKKPLCCSISDIPV